MSPLLVLCVAQFVLQLDFSIVNVALKTIQAELGYSAAGLQWVVTSYALTFGSLLMLGGRLGDRIGRRRLLVSGLVVFALASLACGLAQSPATLVAARFVQGAAAAAIAPTVLSVLTSVYREERERTRALSIWTAALAAGGTSGIVLGGLLTEAFGWRSIFLVNLPVIACLVPAMMRTLPDLREKRPAPIDPVGAAALTASIAALILGLTQGEEEGFAALGAMVPLVLAVAFGIGFLVAERDLEAPMIPRGFLREPARRVSVLTMFLFGGVTASYAYFMALYLQRGLGFSEAETGFGLLPSGALMILVSTFLAHRLIDSRGPKQVLLGGLALTTAALIWFSRIPDSGEYIVAVFPGLMLNAIGIGLVFPAVSLGVTRDLSATERGVAGGMLPASQQVGSAVVLAILATVAAAVAGVGTPVPGYRVAYAVSAVITIVAFVLVARTRFDAAARSDDPGVAAVQELVEVGDGSRSVG